MSQIKLVGGACLVFLVMGGCGDDGKEGVDALLANDAAGNWIPDRPMGIADLALAEDAPRATTGVTLDGATDAPRDTPVLIDAPATDARGSDVTPPDSPRDSVLTDANQLDGTASNPEGTARDMGDDSAPNAPLCSACPGARPDDPAFGCGDATCRSCFVGEHVVPACRDKQCVLGACETGWTQCPGDFGCTTDLMVSAKNCGSCGNTCAASEKCTDGKCLASCAVLQTDCGGSCANLATSKAHCGRCGGACRSPTWGTASCEGGKCVQACPAGRVLCDPVNRGPGEGVVECVDPQSDPANCGRCGNRCPATALGALACVQGTCAQCPPGLTACGIACTQTASDINNCGVCGTRCMLGQLCIKGACQNGGTEVVASGLTDPVDLAVDDGFVYWSDIADNTINRVPKAGGMPQVIADKQGEPNRIAIDDEQIFWTNRLTASVMRVSKGGGTPAMIGGGSQPISLALSRDRVFWLDPAKSAIVTAPKKGGAMVEITTAFSHAGSGLAADESFVYLIQEGLLLGSGVIRHRQDGSDALPQFPTQAQRESVLIARCPPIPPNGLGKPLVLTGNLLWWVCQNGPAASFDITQGCPTNEGAPYGNVIQLVSSGQDVYGLANVPTGSIPQVTIYKFVPGSRHAQQIWLAYTAGTAPPKRIAVDSTHLYMIRATNSGKSTIDRIAR